MRKNIIIVVMFMIIIILLGVSMIEMFFSYEYIVDSITDVKEEYIKNQDIIDYEQEINNLIEYYNNQDVKGILKIKNTDYVVPIMQGNDNDYYLNHTPDKKKNFMGSIYLDYRVDVDMSKKILIYGHNSSYMDMPFKILENYYEQQYYNEHDIVEITTLNGKKEYQIFSVYIETSDFDYMNIDFDTDNDYFNHIVKLKKKSMYDTGIDINLDDEILILQTCSTHKDYSKYKKKYLIIVLKKI